MRTATNTRRFRFPARLAVRAAMTAMAVTTGAGTLLLATSGPAAADPIQLGGYDMVGSASGLSVFYEQPNFPIPNTPTLEMDLGYSNATFDSGPVATANGSAFWPGPIIAGGGSQLPLLLNPYLEQYAPQLQSTVDALIPNPGPWPVAATSSFPQTPNTASNNNGPLVMSSACSASQATATSSVGIVGGPASQSALPAGMLSIQAIGSNVQDGIDAAGEAVTTATSTVHGIGIAGGIIQIGTVSSTATSTSDGNQAKVTGSSTVANATVAGMPVTIDSNGVHAAGNSQNLLSSLLPSVNQVLSTLGISIKLTNPIDKVDGASAIRQLDGLSVDINFTTFDNGYAQLFAALPSQIKSAIIQLPIPTPYKQDLTLDMGWVNVSSAASPPFSLDLGLGALGGDTGSGGGSNLLPTGTITDLGTTPTSTGTSPTSNVGSAPLASSSPVSLFHGLGAGLIVLALLLAIAVMAGLLGADRAVGAMSVAPACVNEENPDLT